MVPQHFTQGRQHIHKRWMPFMFIPRHRLRQQRWFIYRTFGIPRLHQTHQDHCQRSLPIYGFAAPAISGLKSHILFCLQDTFFYAPAIIIPLDNLFIRNRRIGTKEKVIIFLSGRVSNDYHSNRHLATNVIPQASYANNVDGLLGWVVIFFRGFLRRAGRRLLLFSVLFCI